MNDNGDDSDLAMNDNGDDSDLAMPALALGMCALVLIVLLFVFAVT